MLRLFRSQYALVVFSLLLAVSAVSAQRLGSDCSKLVLNHTYVNSFEGILNLPVAFKAVGMPAPPPGVGIEPVGGAGTVKFLANGNFEMKETLAIGLMGLNKDTPILGTYSLNWDGSKQPTVCTGSMTGTETVSGMTVPVNFQLIVYPDANRIEMIHTDTGLMVGMTGQLLPHRACNNFSIAATYSYNGGGWILAPPDAFPPEQMVGGYIPFAMSGVMRFYPETPASVSDFPDSPARAMMVKGWDTPSQNGAIMPRTMTGWYTINHDCTGVVVLRDSLENQDFQLQVFVGADGLTVHSANVNDAVDLGNGISTPPIILGLKLDRMDQDRNQ